MNEPQTIAEQFAKDGWKGYRYFAVTDEIVAQRKDWSGPVQFRFEQEEGGKVQMILRTVDLRSIDAEDK